MPPWRKNGKGLLHLNLLWCPIDSGTRSLEFPEDRFRGGGPEEGPGIAVVMRHELVDALNELPDVPKRTAADRAVRDHAEPAFNLIEPGRVRRREVDVVARVVYEPTFHGRVLVCRVVVDDEMHVELRRDAVIEVAQERQEFLVTMSWLALRDDRAACDIERSEQRGRSMAVVVMGDTFNVPESDRQERLGAFECLNLRLLVYAQHERVFGRIEIQPNNVPDLLDEERIGGEFEVTGSMRLDVEQREIALNRALGDSGFGGQRTHRPLRGPFGFRSQSLVKQRRDALLVMGPRPPGSGLTVQASQTEFPKASPPERHKRLTRLQTLGDLVVPQTVRGPEHHLGAPHQRRRECAGLGQRLQLGPRRGRQLQRQSRASQALRHAHIVPPLEATLYRLFMGHNTSTLYKKPFPAHLTRWPPTAGIVLASGFLLSILGSQTTPNDLLAQQIFAGTLQHYIPELLGEDPFVGFHLFPTRIKNIIPNPFPNNNSNFNKNHCKSWFGVFEKIKPNGFHC